MNDKNGNEFKIQEAPEAIVETHRQISIVWLVPLVALVIGGWLAYKTITEKGPIITITFKTAEGLEVGKTKIKYKDVEVGKVESIVLNKDLTHIIVTAELVKGIKQYLTENTRFWVVRARVAAGEISGLGTLFSGVYIGMDPGKSGAPEHNFIGLEIPPIVTTDQPGRHFVLKAQRLGSLDIGSPIYYKQIKVGQIVSYELEEDKKTIRFRVFIDAPHHELVRENTKFWNTTGIDVDISADGIQVHTESLVSLLLGGIAFDVPPHSAPSSPAQEDQEFMLHSGHEDILDTKSTELYNSILQFERSVRGLSVYAPVEFRGIKLGEVTRIKAEYNLETQTPRILVFITVEPEVFEVEGGETRIPKEKMLERLVEKGMRAQLKTSSLLTGQLFVDFDFYPDAPSARIKYDGIYPELPTIQAPLEMITASLNQLLYKLEKLPIEEIGSSLKNTVQGAERLVNSTELKQAIVKLNQTLNNTSQITDNFNKKVTPELNTTIVQLNDTLMQTEKTLANIGTVVNPDSALYRELRQTMEELGDVAQSIRVMVDYLEQHPDALIYGKGTRE